MQSWQEQFEQWYRLSNNQRRLVWMHGLGEVVIRATYSDGKSYDISLIPLQAAVLTLFQEPAFSTAEHITFAQIQHSSGISEDEVLKRVLHSLYANPKFKLLEKQPATKVITTSDVFSLNRQFSYPLRKVCTPAL